MAYDPSNPFSGGSSPYDVMRNRAQQQIQGQYQGQRDAMQRRYAAAGMQNSGSALHAQQDLDRSEAQDSQDAQGNINFQEMQNAIPIQEAQKQREFAASESEKGRGLAREQLGEQRAEFGQNLEFQKNNVLPLQKTALDIESRKLDQEQAAMQFNEALAQWQQQNSGGLLGAGGFLGTGFGAGGKVFGF